MPRHPVGATLGAMLAELAARLRRMDRVVSALFEGADEHAGAARVVAAAADRATELRAAGRLRRADLVWLDQRVGELVARFVEWYHETDQEASLVTTSLASVCESANQLHDWGVRATGVGTPRAFVEHTALRPVEHRVFAAMCERAAARHAALNHGAWPDCGAEPEVVPGCAP